LIDGGKVCDTSCWVFDSTRKCWSKCWKRSLIDKAHIALVSSTFKYNDSSAVGSVAAGVPCIDKAGKIAFDDSILPPIYS
jgi:hypothetical protein